VSQQALKLPDRPLRTLSTSQPRAGPPAWQGWQGAWHRVGKRAESQGVLTFPRTPQAPAIRPDEQFGRYTPAWADPAPRAAAARRGPAAADAETAM